MARSDLLVSLIKAATKGDKDRLKRAVDAMVIEERAKQHHALADRLIEAVSVGGSSPMFETAPPKATTPTISDLLVERNPERTLADLILPPMVRSACGELIEEQHRSELLRSYNLEPRHRIMLVGPPGNGKTSLAEAIAEGLMLQLLTVRYEGVISSFLGETAQKLRLIFDYARRQSCVLFFDEFDAVGKERGDEHETGEIKRVVNSLLLQIDSLPSHVVVVVATNHPELIDRAAWRRFQIRLELPQPNQALLETWFARFKDQQGQDLGLEPSVLAAKLCGASFAEVEEFAFDVRRRQVLQMPNANLKRIIAERLEQWSARYRPQQVKRSRHARPESTNTHVSSSAVGGEEKKTRRSK